jgi:catechol 2,3-dioxygenase-like lactoylglutathione lyase family enzyme
MLDHVSFAVKNYEESCEFYDETLLILGYKREVTLEFLGGRVAGYGNGGTRPCLWISAGGREDENIGTAQGLHFAFIAPSTATIDEWYAACLKLGAKDNGAPGPRAHYHANYYGAFIVDPNGWRIEACFHHYKP